MNENRPFHLRLTATLLDIHKAGVSTIIRLSRGTEKKQLFIRSGRTVNAESNAPDDHLARILVKLDILPQAGLKKVADLMKTGRISDEAIQQVGGLKPHEIEMGAHEQAIQILASVFSWEDGEIRCYRFEGDTKRRIDLRIPVPDILIAAVRAAVTRGFMPSAIKALKGKLAPETDLSPELLALPLDAVETMAFTQVRDVSALEELIPFLPQERSNPRELLQRLLLLGYLRLVDPQASGTKEKVSRDSLLAAQLDELLQTYETASLYEVLAIPPDASEDAVKMAYHELAKRYHPDRYQAKGRDPGIHTRAGKVFTQIAAAYAVLSNPVRRAGYDEERLRCANPVESALQAKSAAAMEKEKMADLLYRAGRASIAKGEFEKAVEQLRECVYAQPETARYQHALGVAQSEIPKLRKEAEQHLLKALELDKLQIDAYVDLARLYIKVNLPRRAELYLQQALNWTPGNQEVERMLKELAAK